MFTNELKLTLTATICYQSEEGKPVETWLKHTHTIDSDTHAGVETKI